MSWRPIPGVGVAAVLKEEMRKDGRVDWGKVTKYPEHEMATEAQRRLMPLKTHVILDYTIQISTVYPWSQGVM